MAEGQSTTPAPVVEYRDISGFPAHRVGSDGTVWSRWRKKGMGRGTTQVLGESWKQLRPGKNNRGYLYVWLTDDARSRHRCYVHRLVLTLSLIHI
jgi:hypothetical protein